MESWLKSNPVPGSLLPGSLYRGAFTGEPYQLKIRVGNALDEFTRGFDVVRARANGKVNGSEGG